MAVLEQVCARMILQHFSVASDRRNISCVQEGPKMDFCEEKFASVGLNDFRDEFCTPRFRGFSTGCRQVW